MQGYVAGVVAILVTGVLAGTALGQAAGSTSPADMAPAVTLTPTATDAATLAPPDGASAADLACACETDLNDLFVAALGFIRKGDAVGVLPLERWRLYGLAWKRFERIFSLYPRSWVAVRLLANERIGEFSYASFVRRYRLAGVEACGLESGAPEDCRTIMSEHVRTLVTDLQTVETRVIQTQEVITRLETTFGAQVGQIAALSQEVGRLKAEADGFSREREDLLAQIAEVQAQAERHQNSVRAAARKRRDTEIERDQLSALLVEARGRADDLNGQLVSARAELEGRAAGVDQVAFGRLQGELSTTHSRAERLERELAEAMARIGALEAREDVQIIDQRTSFLSRISELGGVADAQEIEGERIVFSSEVLFDVGKASLRPAGRARLDAFASAVLAAAPDIQADLDWALQIDGHTDRRPIATPQFPSNWELSIARSLSVVRYLIERGIAAERLVAAGHAEFHPRELAETEDGFQRNRRVEIRFLTN